MKSSLIAMTAALALTLGISTAAYAQDDGAAANLEECLVKQGAGATPEGESIVSDGPSNETDSNDSEPAAEGLDVATGDAVACPNIDGATDDDDTN